jgi:hypothetical protein
LNRTIIVTVSVMLFALWPVVVLAEHSAETERDVYADGGGEHDGGHHDFKHALGLFLGVTFEVMF